MAVLRRHPQCECIRTRHAKADPAKAKPIAESVCVACHGADGNSPAAINLAPLASQGAAYLRKQLGNQGRRQQMALRESPIMGGMVPLSEEDMDNLAAASQQKLAPAITRTKSWLPRARKSGVRAISRRAFRLAPVVTARQAQAMPAMSPALAAHPEYTEDQLKNSVPANVPTISQHDYA